LCIFVDDIFKNRKKTRIWKLADNLGFFGFKRVYFRYEYFVIVFGKPFFHLNVFFSYQTWLNEKSKHCFMLQHAPVVIFGISCHAIKFLTWSWNLKMIRTGTHQTLTSLPYQTCNTSLSSWKCVDTIAILFGPEE
jgi:hypothetical protein